MDEFELIRLHFAGLAPDGEGVVLGIGDDCALLKLDEGEELAISTDTLVAGRHFPLQTAPYDIGWKSLAVSLSDLAAMGAEPRAFLLALTLEQAEPAWLKAFACGLSDLACRHRVALIGGDTTRGPLNINITAMGVVPRGQALRRSGARVGDAVCVTGTLGDAALGLQRWDQPEAMLRARLDRPEPRVTAGLALRAFAHAAIDLSDGLAGDLAHVLIASGLGARIEAEQLPMSVDFARLCRPAGRLVLQAQGGDDYELCVCLPADRVEAARAALDVPLTVIGQITAEPGLRFVDGAGATIAISPHGYRHFE